MACLADQVPSSHAATTCFGAVYGGVEPPESRRDFDYKFDKNTEGNSFSCDVIVGASDARIAIDRFRAGVIYGDLEEIRWL